MKRSYAVVALICLLSTSLQAEPGGGRYDDGYAAPVTEKPVPKVKVEHTVEASSVKSNFIIEDSLQWKGLMQSYAGKQITDKLKNLPGIKNMDFIPGGIDIDEKYFDKDVERSYRNSSLMVSLAGAANISLMFKVSEELRRCDITTPATEAENLDQWNYSEWSDANIGVTTECKMYSKVTIEGPIAVYGVVPGALENRMLLLNQLKLEWSISPDYGKRDTELRSTFRLNRQDFPKIAGRVLNWTNSSVPFADFFMENIQRNTLVEVGRILKSTNEDILKGL